MIKPIKKIFQKAHAHIEVTLKKLNLLSPLCKCEDHFDSMLIQNSYFQYCNVVVKEPAIRTLLPPLINAISQLQSQHCKGQYATEVLSFIVSLSWAE